MATYASLKHSLQTYQSQSIDFMCGLQIRSEALTSEEHFWQYLKNHPDIEEDDYSLVAIQP